MKLKLNKMIALFLVCALCAGILPGEVLQVKADGGWTKQNGIWVNDKGTPIPGAVKKGIDVSKWQGTIDWKAVKASDVDFVILRCGVGSDLPVQDDPYWEQNVRACEELGIPYGVYLYSYAKNSLQAQNEARHVLRLLKGHHPSYPVYYDLEDRSLGLISQGEIAQTAKTFCETIERFGYRTGIYASKHWFDTKLTHSFFDTKEKWVAQYGSACTYEKDYRMWQCSKEGVVPGIAGKTDLNFLIAEKPGTVSLKGSGTYREQRLRWSHSSYADGYEVFMAQPGKHYRRIDLLPSDVHTAAYKMETGRTCYYIVRAYRNVNGGRLYSENSKAVSVKSALQKTVLKSVKRISGKKIKLQWKKTEGASGYEIVSSSHKKSGYKKAAVIKKGKVSFRKLSVRKGKKHYYKIRAYRKVRGKKVYGAWSSCKSVI